MGNESGGRVPKRELRNEASCNPVACNLRAVTGYRLEKLGDGTMGRPVEPVYRELPEAEAIRVPELRKDQRMSAAPAFLETCGDRYRLASFDLTARLAPLIYPPGEVKT